MVFYKEQRRKLQLDESRFEEIWKYTSYISPLIPEVKTTTEILQSNDLKKLKETSAED